MQQETDISLMQFGIPGEAVHVILAQIEVSYITGSAWSVGGGVDAN